MRFQIVPLWAIIKICHIFVSTLSYLILTVRLPQMVVLSHFADEKAEPEFIEPWNSGAELPIPYPYSPNQRDDEHRSQFLSRRNRGIHVHLGAILNICFKYTFFGHHAVYDIFRTYLFYN